MTPRGAGALATLLLVAIATAAVVHEVRVRLAAGRDPAARLPRGGLLAALSSDRFGSVLNDLETVPVYRALLASPTPAGLRRRLGWAGDIPPVPWRDLHAVRQGAVGFYDRGWLAMFPVDETPKGLAPSRITGRLGAVASSADLLELAPAPSPIPGPARGGSEARLEVDIFGLVSRWGRLGAGVASLLPGRATGAVRASPGSVEETWLLECSGPCVLDFLDGEPTIGSASTGWAALPAEAPAVAWLRIRPGALLGSPAADTGSGSTLGRVVEALERFLGIPLRGLLASALAGPVAVALVEEPGEGPPRLLAALELRRPDPLAKLLERLAALGLLAGSAEVTSYRGVRIVSWIVGSRGRGLEPSLAVDGDTLLVSTRRADLAEGLDRRRRRDRRSSRGRLEEWVASRTECSWKGWSRSAWVLARWEEIVAGPGEAVPAPTPQRTCEAALRRDGTGWVLEGRGAGPALAAEFLVPCLRALLQSAPEPVTGPGSPTDERPPAG